jgi:1-acyl-sn-glycerol-3-phosphate acyltransferase
LEEVLDMGYWICRLAVTVILKLFFRLKVEGLENIPQKTNFIIVANHASFLDPFVIAAAIPKKIYWLALKDIYNSSWLRWFMNMTKALPTGSASEKAIYLLTGNKNIGLFPEGTRTFDGKLREFKRGVALLAIKTGRPILPCAILGTYEAFPRTAKFPRFLPIKIKIGKLKYLLKEFDEIIDDVYLQEGIFTIRNTIKEMMYAG